jgi:hypothetical protein
MVDTSQWPVGDKVWDVARAIAIAEGFGRPTAAPTLLNNPGDISDGKNQFGSEHHSGSDITHFPNVATGWTWLYNKLNNIKEGKSHVYSNEMTWIEFAQKYAGDWSNWVVNVTNYLKVKPTDKVGDYWKD